MTGDRLLDWSKFQQGSVSPAKAFEAFFAQLFERWVRISFPIWSLSNGGSACAQMRSAITMHSMNTGHASKYPENRSLCGFMSLGFN